MTAGSPDWSPRVVSSGTASENKKASVTDEETIVEFTQTILSLLIYNDGPYTVYFSRETGVDTNDFKIPSGSWLMIDVPTSNIYLICDTDKTATCYIMGVY